MSTLSTTASSITVRPVSEPKPAHRARQSIRRSTFGLEGLESRQMMSADPFSAGSSVVFVTDNVQRSEQLTAAFPGADIVHLDSRTNVMEQISRALAGRSGLASIQFLSHGSSGALDLGQSGGQVLNAAALDAAAGTVRSWGSALAADGDIVLWGCNIGAGSSGRAFISKLSSLTGADVAASTNLTGNARVGGDWNLEATTGRVESTAKFVSNFNYGFTLAAPTISGASAGQAVTENNNIRPFNGVVIATGDATVLSVSVTLDTAAKGVFTSASLATSGFASAGGGVYTFTGTAAQATTALSRLTFDPTDNRVNTGSTETTTFTLSASNGVDPAATNSTTTVVTTAVNEVPVISGATAGQSVIDTATVSPFSALTISDADAPTQTLSVTVALDNAGKGAFTSASLIASGFAAAGNGVYTFSGDAAAATAAIQALVFQPTADRVAVGSTETTTFSVSVSDGVAIETCDNGTTVVSTSANNAPSFGGASAGQAVNDTATVSVFSGFTLTDADPAQQVATIVSLDTAAKGSFTPASLMASGFSALGGGQYSFTGTAAQVTTAIRQLVFAPTANRVAVGSTETTTFTVSANDGVASAMTNSTTTAVSTSINDAPTLSGASAGQAVNDNATVSPFSAFSISDVDPSQNVTVTVSLDTAGKGVFTSASLTSSGFASAGGGMYTFTGSASAATNAIRALVYDPTNNRVAVNSTETSTFTVDVDDTVAAVVTDATTTVISTSINDAPVISGTLSGQAVNDNATITPFASVTVTDADTGASLLTVVSIDNTDKGTFTGASLTASGFSSIGGGLFTFSGTPAQAQTALRALVFQPTANRVGPGQTETTTLEIGISDTFIAVNDATTMVVTSGVNDAPSVTGASAGQAVNDNAFVSPFSGVTIGDVDPGQSVIVTVTPDNTAKGIFTSASLTASGFAFNGAAYTFTGTAAAATTAIRALSFDPANNRVAVGSTESTTFTVAVNDSLTTTSNSTTTVVSTSINDAPTITGTSAGQTVSDASTVLPFAAVTIADVDSGQSITVTVALDTAAKGVFTAGSLTASGFINAGGGSYTFTGTAADATTAIRLLAFDPANDRVATGATETTTFTITALDASSASASDNATTVISTNANDAPSINGTSGAVAVNDNATVSPFSGVTVADVDPSTTLSVSVTFDTAAKGVFTSASLTASGFVSAGGGIYTFTGSPSAVTTALQALVLDPTNNRVAPAATEQITLTISVSDSVAAAVTDSGTVVTSTSVNDAPTVAGSSAGQTVTDITFVSPFTGVTIAEADVSQNVTVSVALDTTAKGIFTSASLTASGFVDAGSGVYTFSGTAAAATTAIRALSFDPANNRVAAGSTETATFTITVSDGVAADVTDSATTVVSTSVNDATTFSGSSASQAVNDNATVMPFSAFTISDVDSPAQMLTVQVLLDTAAKGSFTVLSLINSGFADMGAGVYSFSGTASAATTAIRALVFQPTANRVAPGQTETTTLVVLVNDGVANATTNANSVVSTSVNDAPSISGTSVGQAVNDNGFVSPFSGVTIADVDVGQNVTVSVTLDTAAKGVFTSASLTASGFASAGGGVYTFTGTAAAATTAIRVLSFDAANNRVAVGSTETTTFTIAVNDAVAATVTSSATTVVSTSINDAPTVTGVSAGQAVNDNQTIFAFSVATITEVDVGQSVTVTVTLDDAAKGVFTQGSLTASGFIDIGGGAYSYNGTAAQVTAAIRQLAFDPSDNRVSIGAIESTTFEVFFSDGTVDVTDSTTTVNSVSVNDVPTVTGTEAGQIVTDITTVQPFAGVTIGDNDNPAQSVTVTITLDVAAKGIFTSDSLTASGFIAGIAGVYTFTGSAANATDAIRALEFNPTNNRVTPGESETTTFTVAVNDGFTTATNTTSSVASLSINDETTLSTGVSSQEADDGASVAPLSGGTTVNPFSTFQVSDADTMQELTVTVTLDDADKGAFTGSSLLNSGFVSTGGGVYTFTGTAEEASNALQNLAFDPANNRVAVGSTETTNFTVTVSDGSADVTDTNTSVDATSVNDTPVLTGAVAGQLTNESQNVTPFTTFSIADPDVSQDVTVTITLDNAAKGVFTPASLEASGFVAQGSGVYTFTGSASEAVAAMAALSYDPTNNRVAINSNDTTRFTVTVSDGVATNQTSNTTTVVSRSVNDGPSITNFTVSGPITRGSNIVLTATGVADPDNTAAVVEFYRDANGNGVLDIGIDTLLATGGINSLGVSTKTVNTASFGAGENTFFARSRDVLQAFGETADTSGTINNRAPVVGSFSRSPEPVVNAGGLVTLRAGGVSDPDGTIDFVQFYRDADGNGQLDTEVDTLLGTDTNSAGGWQIAVATSDFPTGTNRYFARAVDNDESVSNTVTVTGRVNAAPSFTTFAAGASTVVRKTTLALSASGASDSDGTINRVEFYRDTNANGTFEAGTDTLLGSDSSASSGNYTFNVNTTGFTTGTNTFFSRVRDNNGAYSAARTITAEVTNVAPTIASMSRSVATLANLGDSLTLTANTVADSDGTVASVQFYRDVDGNGLLDVNVDSLLGTDSSSVGGFALTVNTNFFTAGTNRYFARAVDSDGDTSNVVTVTNVVNAAPTATSLTVSPGTISRAATYTLTVSGAADTDGTISRVEFYRDRGIAGTFESSVDQFLGNGTFTGGVYHLTLNGSSLAIGTHTFFARVRDNNGGFSSVVQLTATVTA